VRGPEGRTEANQGWLVRRFLARLRCGGRASGRPVHRAGDPPTVYLFPAKHNLIRM